MSYDSEKLYVVVRRRRAQRSMTKDSMSVDDWLNLLILEDCMREPYCRRHVKFNGQTRRPRQPRLNTNPGAYGYRTGNGVFEPGLTEDDWMAV